MIPFRLLSLPSYLVLLLAGALPTFAQNTLDKAFLNAVENRDVEKIQSLLTAGADVNAKEHINGHFALQYAINWPDAGLVKLLLDKGADVDLADSSGYTALTDAAHEHGPEYTAIVKLLVGRGANIHANHDRAIFGAAQEAEPEVVELLIKKGAPVNARSMDNEGGTVLMAAAQGGSVEKIQILLDAGADIKASDNLGETALMKAASVDHRYDPNARVPMIRLLLSKGAEVNARDKRGATALLHAVVQQMSEAGGVISHPEVVRLLLDQGADVQCKDNNGNTALIITVGVWQGPLEIVRLLLEKGIDVNARNAKGESALMISAGQGKLDVTHLLLEKGADANLKDAAGHSTLDHAIEQGQPDLVKLLLAKGAVANSVYKSNTEIMTATTNFALLRAVTSNRMPEVNALFAGGADVNARDAQGNTPLVRAVQYSYGPLEILKLLLEKGADIDAVNGSGENALMWAAERNAQEAAKILLDHKAAVNLRNKAGNTALHIAATGLHADIVRGLLANRAEVDARDADGKTPLTRSTEFEGAVPDEVMQALLDHGADINAQDNQGNTALMLAAKSGSMSGVEFLLNKGAKTDLKNKAGQTALKYARAIHENQRIFNSEIVETRIIAMLKKAGAKE